jgi:hypothetical protein
VVGSAGCRWRVGCCRTQPATVTGSTPQPRGIPAAGSHTVLQRTGSRDRLSHLGSASVPTLSTLLKRKSIDGVRAVRRTTPRGTSRDCGDGRPERRIRVSAGTGEGPERRPKVVPAERLTCGGARTACRGQAWACRWERAEGDRMTRSSGWRWTGSLIQRRKTPDCHRKRIGVAAAGERTGTERKGEPDQERPGRAATKAPGGWARNATAVEEREAPPEAVGQAGGPTS